MLGPRLLAEFDRILVDDFLSDDGRVRIGLTCLELVADSAFSKALILACARSETLSLIA